MHIHVCVCPAGSLRIKVHKFGANHPPREAACSQKRLKCKLPAAPSAKAAPLAHTHSILNAHNFISVWDLPQS